MVRKIVHKGLRLLWERGASKGVDPSHIAKLGRILDRLNIATHPEDMNLPGYRLHELKGEYRGYWSVTVQANWRVVFRFEGVNVTDVDYLDYH